MKISAHVFVSGRVQGVFFRLEAKHEANKRGVKGWVRNLQGGRVEAVFEGEEAAVKELVQFCRRGPQGAIVTSVDVMWENYTNKFEDFQIRRSF